jgi:hypothetical protein
MEMSTYTCGETTMAKEFHFVSPTFQLTIYHECPKMGAKDLSAICMIILDFEKFNMQPPLLGTCHYDKFYASGKYPLLCGDNPTRRAWKTNVAQIPCPNMTESVGLSSHSTMTK